MHLQMIIMLSAQYSIMIQSTIMEIQFICLVQMQYG